MALDHPWLRALAVYREPRLLVVLLMGFASGLPLLLTLSTLSYWLAKVGVDKTAIGLFAAVGTPYTLKFLWAPLLDQLRVPLLSRRLGRRRGWLVAIQLGLALAIVGLGVTDPAAAPWQTALLAVLVATLSASQDIVIDAYRIEILRPEEQGAGAAATQIGYRIGMLVAGAGAIALSDVWSWPAVFAALAALVLASLLVTLLAPEPLTPAPRAPRAPAGARLREAVIEPFAEFMRRPGWAAVLGFVLLYKFGDAVGGVMANPFYVEMGFSGTEIAAVTKLFGVLATLIGALAGGLAVARYGLFRTLLAGGIAQAATNLAFAALALRGHDIGYLTGAIAIDNFAGGLASAALVAYLSRLCNLEFTATQYALLTSFMAQGRTLLATSGGWLADHTDWVTFFVLTALLAIPGLLLLVRLMRGGEPAPATQGASS